ncbi:hypothetical protein Dsin_013091 [Dipteronia sinensis]|uniref:Uncharacterized protein n=1 Tax=Dipteronia sinensis TaxID=43782 RepID=A0AAE0AJH7_9ROSI|nr:hypothetical protein Dsin_013091 [Dipteronia sinensis]
MMTRSDVHVKSQNVINLVRIRDDLDDRDIPLTNRKKNYAKKILDPQRPFTNWISLMLGVMSISMDPFFFYTPVIKMDKNCLDLDTNLGIISCVFRSVIDLSYIIYINFQPRNDISAPHPVMSCNSNSPYRSHKGYIDLLAVLPMPQVVIIIILLKSSPSKILEAMNMHNSLRWRAWAACVIQDTWRGHHCLKNLEEHRHEDEKRVKNAPGATPYAANELPQKPADPDCIDEE